MSGGSRITVRLLHGNSESHVAASLDDTAALFAERHFPDRSVRLIAGGAELQGARTLHENGVENNSVVHAVVGGHGTGASTGAGGGAARSQFMRSTTDGPARWFHSHPTETLLVLTALPLLAGWSFFIRDKSMQAGATFWLLVLFTAVHFAASAPVLARM